MKTPVTKLSPGGVATWKRIGVPDAVANEMASDLEADLAEAEADGVSPEEVLGNGVFDAPSFAASWAAARGVATTAPAAGRRSRPWALVTGGAVAVVAWFIAGAISIALIAGVIALLAGPLHVASELSGKVILMNHP